MPGDSADICYTADDLLRMEDGPPLELVDGRLVVKGVGAQMSAIGASLLCRVCQFADRRRLGYTFGPKCGYQLFAGRPNHVRSPNGSFVKRGRFPDERIPTGHVPFPPDLAAEIVAYTDLACDVMERVEDYLQAGVPLTWVVYPRTQRVLVFRANGQVTRLTDADTLSGEDVLPGFACPVADLFAGL